MENCNCKNQEMDCVKEITVIRSTNKRRGDGVKDPIRIITEYWCIHGELLAEIDPNDTSWGNNIPTP